MILLVTSRKGTFSDTCPLQISAVVDQERGWLYCNLGSIKDD